MHLEEELTRVVGDDWVITGEKALLYSQDAFLASSGRPSIVVLPGTEEEAVKVLRLLFKKGVKVIPRGSGTSLSGGSSPLGGEIVVSLTRLNRVYKVEGFEVEVGPGIANATVSKSVPPHLFYAPDPSSYIVSSIGGNISHDSGGIRVVKYGPTYSSVLGVKVLLTNGEVEEMTTSPVLNPKSIFVGAEGMLGVVLRARLRLFRRPEGSKTIVALFNSLEAAARAIVGIFKAGVVPSGLELMDRNSIRAVERSRYRAGLPEVEAVLLIELDGTMEELKREESRVRKVLEDLGAEIIVPKDKEEESRLWSARKGAFPAMATVAPAYLTLDCNVLRGKLPEALTKIKEIAEKYKVYIANVFHAGDGNLHPLISFNPNDRESVERAIRAGLEIERLAISLGGVPSGEHGIGIEKLGVIKDYYNDVEIGVMRRVKEAFDPQGLLNPCKMLPDPSCKPTNDYLRVMWEWD